MDSCLCKEPFQCRFRSELLLEHGFRYGIDRFRNFIIETFQFRMVIKEMTSFQVPVKTLQLMVLYHQIR